MVEHELTGRLSGEVVEVYRPKEYREVVEAYTRPLPESMRPKPVLEYAPAPKKRRKKRFWIALICLTLLTILGLGGWMLFNIIRWSVPPMGGFASQFPMLEQNAAHEISIPTWPTGQGAKLHIRNDHDEAITIQEVYRRVNPSVVTVLSMTDIGYYVGTGVIFSEDGYILTNYHTLRNGTQCVVALENDARYDALYVAGDEAQDIAVLKIDATDLPVAEFGDSDLLQVGDPAHAIGNPLNLDLRGTLTTGIISAISRDVMVEGKTMTLLQTDAALNKGNSGGPLINQYGQVVGINVVKMTSATYGGTSVEGLGFAIPTSKLDRVVNDLVTFGEVKPEPLLGISVYNTATQLEGDLYGACIDSVTPGGAGDKAGLLPGDYILASGDTPLTTSQDVLRLRRQYHMGDELPMTIWRDGEIMEVILQLEQTVE